MGPEAVMDDFMEMSDFRREAGLSQEALALILAGLTGEPWDQSKVSRVEREPQKASVGDVLAMARALGIEDPLRLFARERAEATGLDLGLPLHDLTEEVRDLHTYVDAQLPYFPAGDLDILNLDVLRTSCELRTQKPVVAFLGAYDAGKSTLVNTILGAPALPTGYQPTTRAVTYVRHVNDRPDWLHQPVLLLSDGFDPSRWREESHCREFEVPTSDGTLDTLREFGVHRRDGAVPLDVAFALVFLEAPVLHSCTILDLPGLDHDATDTARATGSEVYFDVAVFVDTAIGFLNEGTLVRLADTIARLPVLGPEHEVQDPLRNLLILATHAHPGITDEQLCDEILLNGVSRTWRHIGDTLLASRTQELGGEPITLQQLASRFFGFYRDVKSRRDPALSDLSHLLKIVIPSLRREGMESDVQEFLNAASTELHSKLSFFRQIIDNRAEAESQITALRSEEPFRKKTLRHARKAVEESLNRHRVESREQLREFVAAQLSPTAITSIIVRKFPDKKDAQKNAAAYVIERLRHHTESDLRSRSKQIAGLVDDYLSEYDALDLNVPSVNNGVRVPFNARGAFAGGLAGVAGVGALAAWAATLGNLGAYIIVAKAVSALAALGISTGGVAVWVSAVATIGGPVTVAAGIVVIAAIAGYGLIRGNWQDQLARKISDHLRKEGYVDRYLEALDEYWDETAEAFRAGADRTEQEWKQNLENLEQALHSDFKAASAEVENLEAIERFLAHIPWRNRD